MPRLPGRRNLGPVGWRCRDNCGLPGMGRLGQKGTATHLLLEKVDLGGAMDRAAIEGQLARLLPLAC